jgi:hypothetical protein
LAVAAIPRQSAVFDERRNTSRVWPVPPDALPNARRALISLRNTDPALVQWIEDGYPTLTELEHIERFGAAYKSHRSRRAA